MRLFIALPVPADVRRALTETQARLLRLGARGRTVPPDNFHMTLAFLGFAADPAPAIGALQSVPVPKTALEFDRLALFGDVLVVLYKKNETQEQYVRALRAALDAAGVRFDRQAFRPHITLCRKTALPSPDFRLSDAAAKPLRALRLPVREARLFSSDLSGGAPKYAVVFTKR